MKYYTRLFVLALSLALVNLAIQAQDAPKKQAIEVFTESVQKLAGLFSNQAGAAPRTFTANLELTKGEGIPKELLGRKVNVALQSPDKLKLVANIDKEDYTLGRLGQVLWIHAPSKNFALEGNAATPRFSTAPDKKDSKTLGPISLPVQSEQLALVPLLFKAQSKASETVDQVSCTVISAAPQPQAMEALKIPNMTITVWVRDTDQFPARIAYDDGKNTRVQVDIHQPKFEDAWSEDKWALHANAKDHVEKVALSHVTRFLDVAYSTLNSKIPTLGPATGERKVVASEGAGRLEIVDDTRVLYLKGTPEEMGRQHGILMRKQVHDLVDKILYGVGVGSSFGKGKWFIGEIEAAQARLNPFMNERYFREMDSLAMAANLDKEEVRLANFFPELFHCSGFSIYGDATTGGRMYHGRILDYMKGVGLEQNAVVIVHQPDKGNAWVNISYAGFVGSVTAMNEKHISIGEMGGRGEGQWDGKPMAHLVREVMENASTLEEAVNIMRTSKRTCEYYYVISDGINKKAVGIAATPDTFELVEPGKSHPKLPHAFKDAVLMSAGDRYEKLSERVKDGYGKFTEQSARDLMTRPVCMNSNIHSVMFAPDTLDFWVANADSKNVASHTRYTHYNLGEMLKNTPPASTLKTPDSKARASAGN